MPDSCCKTVVAHCGQRAHPSNIYKVEVSAEVIQELGEDPQKVQLSRQVWESKNPSFGLRSQSLGALRVLTED